MRFLLSKNPFQLEPDFSSSPLPIHPLTRVFPALLSEYRSLRWCYLSSKQSECTTHYCTRTLYFCIQKLWLTFRLLFIII